MIMEAAGEDVIEEVKKDKKEKKEKSKQKHKSKDKHKEKTKHRDVERPIEDSVAAKEDGVPAGNGQNDRGSPSRSDVSGHSRGEDAAGGDAQRSEKRDVAMDKVEKDDADRGEAVNGDKKGKDAGEGRSKDRRERDRERDRVKDKERDRDRDRERDRDRDRDRDRRDRDRDRERERDRDRDRDRDRKDREHDADKGKDKERHREDDGRRHGRNGREDDRGARDHRDKRRDGDRPERKEEGEKAEHREGRYVEAVRDERNKPKEKPAVRVPVAAEPEGDYISEQDLPKPPPLPAALVAEQEKPEPTDADIRPQVQESGGEISMSVEETNRCRLRTHPCMVALCMVGETRYGTTGYPFFHPAGSTW
jgi:hypothetical protein